jgi:hypothetical protein
MTKRHGPNLPATPNIIAFSVLVVFLITAIPLARTAPADAMVGAGSHKEGTTLGRVLVQEPTFTGVYFDLQTGSTSGSLEVFALTPTRFFMRLWEANGDVLSVPAPYDVTPDNRLRLCYITYRYLVGDPLNTRFWTTLASGWVHLDPATYSGPTFSGTWTNEQRYVGPEGTGTWVRLDPPDGPHPVNFLTTDAEFNPFANTEFPGCGGAGGTSGPLTATPTVPPGTTIPTATPTRTVTRTATPTRTPTPTPSPSPSPTPCIQGVRGFVRDAQTRSGVGGILVRAGDQADTTSSNGRYRVEVPTAGLYQVFAGQTREYQGTSESVRIPDCGFVEQDILLQRAATPTPQGGGEPYAIFLLTNASNGLYLGTESSLRGRTRCSFEGGGVGCTASDVVQFQRLLGPFPTQAEARAALCGAITERRVFPLGVGLKGRWQGGETWYGLWDSTVTFSCS